SRLNPLAEPERVEDAVELVPVGLPRRKQMLERRTQQAGLFDIARRHQCGGVPAFVQAYRESVIPQGSQKRRELCRDEARDLVDLVISRICAAATHATFPSRRSVTSRVRRDLSSWVLRRHIRVSWTVSGTSCRSRTSSPTSAAAQSSVSATPGTLRSSSLRTLSTMRAICSDSEAPAPLIRAMMMRASRSTSG